MITETKTSVMVEPYLFFGGRCEEALEFYKEALGADVPVMMRFKDSPEPFGEGDCPTPPGDKIMHANVRIGETMLMVSDGCGETGDFKGFSLSLTVPNEAEAERLFKALNQGGKTEMPLTRTFFSPKFGMVQDRFGVSWMVLVKPEEH